MEWKTHRHFQWTNTLLTLWGPSLDRQTHTHTHTKKKKKNIYIYIYISKSTSNPKWLF
jgi:hypothetical protein